MHVIHYIVKMHGPRCIGLDVSKKIQGGQSQGEYYHGMKTWKQQKVDIRNVFPLHYLEVTELFIL